MAGILTREEPLIKQLVRSRALNHRDNSLSPARSRSQMHRCASSHNSKSDVKPANVPPIRSSSQPPPINSNQQFCNRAIKDIFKNISQTHINEGLASSVTSPYIYKYFPCNATGEVCISAQNLKSTDHKLCNIRGVLGMSTSQPNLPKVGTANQLYRLHNNHSNPTYFNSSRCSSISTLPPSSSRCGSPIQPTLLSPLRASNPSTPHSSHHNISLVPLVHQDTIPTSQESGGIFSSRSQCDFNGNFNSNYDYNKFHNEAGEVTKIRETDYTAIDEARPYTCRDEWRTALESERQYSRQINQKYYISDGISAEEETQSSLEYLQSEDTHCFNEVMNYFPYSNKTETSRNIFQPAESASGHYVNNNTSEKPNKTLKILAKAQNENEKSNYLNNKMSNDLYFPESNRNFEKLTTFNNECPFTACSSFNNLYCKICNLFGPYNGSDVQKLSLFTVSADISSHRASPSIIKHDNSETPAVENALRCVTVDKISRKIPEIKPVRNLAEYRSDTYGPHQDEKYLFHDRIQER